MIPGDIMGFLHKLSKSITNSYGKELNNMDPKDWIKKGLRYVFTNSAVDVFGNKLKEGISKVSGLVITLTNDEIKVISS